MIDALYYIDSWVSGAYSVHHPFVWACCMRYLHSTELKDRFVGKNYFLPESFSAMLVTSPHSRFLFVGHLKREHCIKEYVIITNIFEVEDYCS